MFVARIFEKHSRRDRGRAPAADRAVHADHMLEGDKEPVTADRLAEITQQSKSAVQKQLQKLEDVDVIEHQKP